MFSKLENVKLLFYSRLLAFKRHQLFEKWIIYYSLRQGTYFYYIPVVLRFAKKKRIITRGISNEFYLKNDLKKHGKNSDLQKIAFWWKKYLKAMKLIWVTWSNVFLFFAKTYEYFRNKKYRFKMLRKIGYLKKNFNNINALLVPFI